MWDLNSLVAIDIHTHAHTPPEAADPEELAQRAAMKAYFGNKGEELTTPAIAAYYRERKIGCVIFTVDSEKESGHRRYPKMVPLPRPSLLCSTITVSCLRAISLVSSAFIS